MSYVNEKASGFFRCVFFLYHHSLLAVSEFYTDLYLIFYFHSRTPASSIYKDIKILKERFLIFFFMLYLSVLVFKEKQTIFLFRPINTYFVSNNGSFSITLILRLGFRFLSGPLFLSDFLSFLPSFLADFLVSIKTKNG